jgi:hypothetical protein
MARPRKARRDVVVDPMLITGSLSKIFERVPEYSNLVVAIAGVKMPIPRSNSYEHPESSFEKLRYDNGRSVSGKEPGMTDVPA